MRTIKRKYQGKARTEKPVSVATIALSRLFNCILVDKMVDCLDLKRENM